MAMQNAPMAVVLKYKPLPAFKPFTSS